MPIETPAAGGSQRVRCFHFTKLRKYSIFNQIKQPRKQQIISPSWNWKTSLLPNKLRLLLIFTNFLSWKLPIIQMPLKININEMGACRRCSSAPRQRRVNNSAKLCSFSFFFLNMFFTNMSLSQHNVSQRWLISLSVSFAGQYHLQIENAQLEDDAPFECQAGQSESSGAIISSSAWVNVLSELNSGKRAEGNAVPLINMNYWRTYAMGRSEHQQPSTASRPLISI